MHVPMSWLREYVSLDCDLKEFEEKMTMFGQKVEETERLGNQLANIVVGKVLSITKHPQADKLVITQVDAGGGEPLQIVTGADNLKPGDYVPVALDGAVLAGGAKIKKSKMRGEGSNGMLCSIEELGYTAADYPDAAPDGIYVLDKPYEPGADVRPIMELCEDVVEFEITSNRSDCNSVAGLAREAAAAFGKEFRPPEIHVREEAQGEAAGLIGVDIQNPEACPRYITRVVKDVTIGPSPQWLRHRLTAAGLRPINNIVDITNYVMLELGQPMHAFDIDGIALNEAGQRRIIVRNALDGESFTTLDGVARRLDASMLVIADCDKAVAVAGVMGGENSKVTGTASAILFESANFYGPGVRQTSKKLGLRTDASSRYEKGLDPNLALAAVNRAAQLVELLGCGKIVPGMADNYPNRREPRRVAFDPANVNRVLGTALTPEQMCVMLRPLGIAAENNVAEVPTFRPDVELEADITEELARLYGYDNIRPTLASGTATAGKKSFRQKAEDAVRNTISSFGLREALHYSFESPKAFDRLNIPAGGGLRNAVVIQNPLGEDFSVMRTQTANAMLQSLSTNYNRRSPQAGLFEIGKVYLPKSLPLADWPDERDTLTIGFYGMGGFFELKGIVERLLGVLGVVGVAFEPEQSLTFMHPGRCAALAHKDGLAGFLGEAHPQVCAAYGLDTKAYLACVNLAFLYEHADFGVTFRPLPKFPGVTRDVALLVDEAVPAARVEAAIRERGGPTLKNVALFDVYQGEQVEPGCKSMAYTLLFRAEDRTLTDEDVSKTLRKILANLETKVGARLRGQ